MIETEIWIPNPEKPGYLMLERKKTYAEVFEELVQVLKEQGVYDGLDYFSNMMRREQEKGEFRDWRWIACYAVEGGNEGHYIHVATIFDNTSEHWKTETVFMGKTFMGMDHALNVANICTKAFYGNRG